MIFNTLRKCKGGQCVREPDVSLLHYWMQYVGYKANTFFFSTLVAAGYGKPGTIVECNDGNIYRVMHNNFENTVVLYKPNSNTFTIIQCAMLNNFADTHRFIYTITVEIIRNAGVLYTPIKYDPLIAVKRFKNSTNILDFHYILKKFSRIIEINNIYRLTMATNAIQPVRDQHIHLLYLCERPALIIQRMFRKAIADPRYKMCRSRLMREYATLVESSTSCNNMSQHR